MKKLFGKIFGSEKNTETIVSGAVAGIDKMFFTKEEKSDASGKLRDWWLKYLAASQPQNIARRFIAMVIVILWALLIVVGVAAYPLDPAFSMFIFDVLRDVVMNPFLLIMGFYFAAHLGRSWNDSKN